MTRKDFEIRAAEFFLCCDNVEEQYEELLQLGGDKIPNGIGEIIIWEPFIDYDVSQILGFIETLADNYEEIYNLGNEGRKENA